MNVFKESIQMRQAVTPTFGRIDSESVHQVVQSVLTGLGLVAEVVERVKSRRCTVKDAERGKVTHFGTRTYSEYRLMNPAMEVTGPAGEALRAVIRITDTNLPGEAFRVSVGYFRLICLNGLFGLQTEAVARVTHRVGPTARGKLDALPAAIEAALASLPALQARAMELASMPVAAPVEVVKALDLPEKVRNQVLSLIAFSAFRRVDQPTNVWGLYNIINEVDRLLARQGSTAYLQRDSGLVDAIVALAQGQAA